MQKLWQSRIAVENQTIRFNVYTGVVPGNFEPSNHSAQLPNTNPTASSPIKEKGPQVKLPKLDVKKFDGEV